MFAADQSTFQSLQALDSEVRAKKRPLIIWVGAGVGAWAGYPLWNDLAAQMHSTFSREVHSYKKEIAAQNLLSGKFPDLFQLMRDSDSQRYFSMLADVFSPKSVSPVFERFVKTLQSLSPHCVLTTNVDESLERRIDDAVLIQRSDLERASTLLQNSQSFFCKLHGTISSIATTVFSTQDYDALVKDEVYMGFLRNIFANSNIIFLGYSVRDEYVIQTLLAANEERKLFGAGKHFVVCPEGVNLPSGRLNPIRYSVETNSDHRSCLHVLDEILVATKSEKISVSVSEPLPKNPSTNSTYFIADLVPPGRWQTGQTLRIKGETGIEHELLTGCGYVEGEVELAGYSAMHDIVVGLLCFEKISFTLASLPKMYTLLGSDTFWQLVYEDVFKPVHHEDDRAIAYEDPGAIAGGQLINIALRSPKNDGYAPLDIDGHIGRSLTAVPGRELEAEAMLARLRASVTTLSHSRVAETARGALAHPSLRRMLGISGGTSLSAIPRWVAYPVLRMASVVSTGEYCQHLNASAARLIWGSERLAGAAFSAASGQEWADSAASYVLTGRFGRDVGAAAAQNPQLLTAILEFRRSSAGESFRREVTERLATNAGGDLVSAINLGLRQSLSTSTLEQARDQFAGLFVPHEPQAKMTPAILGDLRNGDQRIAAWRRRSKRLLEEICVQLNIKPYDSCPCGSGEKLKFCCQEALSS